MDKRFVNFAFASLITLLVFTSLNRILFPPPPPGDDVAAVDGADEQGNDNDNADGADQNSAEASSDADAATLAESADTPDGDTKSDAVQSTLSSQQRGAMGSLDPASGYNMLVTWNNRGASIERIELNNASALRCNAFFVL